MGNAIKSTLKSVGHGIASVGKSVGKVGLDAVKDGAGMLSKASHVVATVGGDAAHIVSLVDPNSGLAKGLASISTIANMVGSGADDVHSFAKNPEKSIKEAIKVVSNPEKLANAVSDGMQTIAKGAAAVANVAAIDPEFSAEAKAIANVANKVEQHADVAKAISDSVAQVAHTASVPSSTTKATAIIGKRRLSKKPLRTISSTVVPFNSGKSSKKKLRQISSTGIPQVHYASGEFEEDAQEYLDDQFPFLNNFPAEDYMTDDSFPAQTSTEMSAMIPIDYCAPNPYAAVINYCRVPGRELVFHCFDRNNDYLGSIVVNDKWMERCC